MRRKTRKLRGTKPTRPRVRLDDPAGRKFGERQFSRVLTAPWTSLDAGLQRLGLAAALISGCAGGRATPDEDPDLDAYVDVCVWQALKVGVVTKAEFREWEMNGDPHDARVLAFCRGWEQARTETRTA